MARLSSILVGAKTHAQVGGIVSAPSPVVHDTKMAQVAVVLNSIMRKGGKKSKRTRMMSYEGVRWQFSSWNMIMKCLNQTFTNIDGTCLHNNQIKLFKLRSVHYQNYHLCRSRMKIAIWTHMLI